MHNDLLQQKQRYKIRRKRHNLWRRIVVVLACIVVFCTTYALILPTLTKEQVTYCGMEEHVHGPECYERRLICGFEEGMPSTESSEGLEADHVHDCESESVDANSDEGSEDSEAEPIHAADSENIPQDDLTNTLAEAEAVPSIPTESAAPAGVHVHTDACYELVLICEKPEHTHNLACFSNPEADVETRDVWERLVAGVDMTGVWADDLIGIAQSQLGYTESTANYIVMDDEKTIKGYTRYGDWYGDAYADWDAMFVSFCLDFAKIPNTSMPRDASCDTWADTLSKSDWDLYRNVDEYTPVRGDLVFFDRDSDGKSDRVGIIAEYSTEASKMETIEGDSENKVQYVKYKIDDSRILGYAELPHNQSMAAMPKARAMGVVDYTFEVLDNPDADSEYPVVVTSEDVQINDSIKNAIIAAAESQGNNALYLASLRHYAFQLNFWDNTGAVRTALPNNHFINIYNTYNGNVQFSEYVPMQSTAPLNSGVIVDNPEDVDDVIFALFEINGSEVVEITDAVITKERNQDGSVVASYIGVPFEFDEFENNTQYVLVAMIDATIIDAPTSEWVFGYLYKLQPSSTITEFGSYSEDSTLRVGGSRPQLSILTKRPDFVASGGAYYNRATDTIPFNPPIKSGLWIGGHNSATGEPSNYELGYCADYNSPLRGSITETSGYRKLGIDEIVNIRSDEPVNLTQLKAVLQNSYPFVSVAEMNSALGGTNYTKNELIAGAQAAVWQAIHGISYSSSVGAIKDALLNLEPKVYSEYTITDRIATTSGLRVTLNQSVAVGDSVEAKLTSGNASITIPFTAGSSEVLIPWPGGADENSSYTLEITGTQKVKTCYYYQGLTYKLVNQGGGVWVYEERPNDPTSQDLVNCHVDNRPISIVINEDENDNLYINKVDETGNLLSGAVLEIKNSAGDSIRTHTTNTTAPWDISDLLPGTYIFSETSAPAGYKKIEDFEFEIAELNGEKFIVVANPPVEVSIINNGKTIRAVDRDNKLYLEKVKDNGDPLSGATITFTEVDNNGIPTGTQPIVKTTNGTKMDISELVEGKTYRFEETVTPDGYIMIPPFLFTVNLNNGFKSIAAQNPPTGVTIENGNTIRAVDLTNSDTITYAASKVWSDGADRHTGDSVIVRLTDNNGNPVGDDKTLNSGNNWHAEWGPFDLTATPAAASYRVVEVNVPNGYTVSYSTDITSSTSETGTLGWIPVDTITAGKDYKLVTGSVMISAPSGGTGFAVTSPFDDTSTTDTASIWTAQFNGTITSFVNKATGNDLYMRTGAPNRVYVYPGAHSGNKTATYNPTTDQLKLYGYSLYLNGTAVMGRQDKTTLGDSFTLYEYTNTFTSTSNTMISYTVTNTPIPAEYTLPETGGSGTQNVVLGGLMLFVTSAALLYIRSRRREREYEHGTA